MSETYDLYFWSSVGAIAFLLVLSAFFSGSETAMTAASNAKMHALEHEGNHRAIMVNRLRRRKDRLLGALLLGNNLVNILASALAASVLIRLAGDAGVAYATLIMTVLVLIFAEVLPKTYAMHYADKMALAIAPVMRALVVVLSPVTEAISWIVRRVLHLFGIDVHSVNLGPDIYKLRGAIELHRGAEGSEDEETRRERAMLRSILDLGKVEVGDIMTHRKNVSAMNAETPLRKLVAEVLDSPFTRIPLWRERPDDIIGVLHAKALLRLIGQADSDPDNIDILSATAPPWFIPDTTTLFDQLRAFQVRHEHFALVVDEYGALQGVVTLEDILEEIVGDIADEHDVAVAGVRPQPNGTFIVDGTVTIRDLNREYEWRLPDERYATVAGLVLYEARRIPDVGRNFTFFDFRFDVLRRQRNQITLLRITPPKDMIRMWKPRTDKTDTKEP